MTHALHPRSPYRIFAFSTIATLVSLILIATKAGAGALLVALVLIAVEVAFSFDNAILNAKILNRMSRTWQNLFLTVGAVIAIFGMRVVFPILIVSLTAHLGWPQVVDLALNHPEEYASKLEHAHPAISAFGGAFLLILALDFFVDETRQVVWLTRFERSLQKLARHWAPPAITLGVVGFMALLPFNSHKSETLLAGILGVVVYSLIHGLIQFFGQIQQRRKTVGPYVGMAAFISFLYLEVLDASFSFDGVIGAFAVTNKVILIATGLGIGALWVRSLTIFMVRRGTLGNYRYIEHGAHYTIAVLGCLLFVSLVYNVPEVITGLAGIGIIVSSIIASRQAMAAKKS